MRLPITKANISIRNFVNNDFHGIRDWVNDNDVTCNLIDSYIFDHTHSEAETRAFLESTFIADDANYKLAVADSATNEYYGQINIFNFNESNKSCSFDIVVRRKHWKQGIAYKATTALMNELLADSGISTFIVEVKSTNIAALSLFSKLGFDIQDENHSIVQLIKSVRKIQC